MILVRCVYFSDAVLSDDFDARNSQIQAILHSAREFNQPINVTGALVYDRGHFLQVLEGDRENVGRIMERVMRDDRHRNIRLADFSEINERRFNQWSMGYVDADSAQSPVHLKTFSNAPVEALIWQIQNYLSNGEISGEPVRQVG